MGKQYLDWQNLIHEVRCGKMFDYIVKLSEYFLVYSWTFRFDFPNRIHLTLQYHSHYPCCRATHNLGLFHLPGSQSSFMLLP